MLPQVRCELLHHVASFLTFTEIGCAGRLRRGSGWESQEDVHLHRGGEAAQQILVLVRVLIEMLSKFIFALKNCRKTEWNDRPFRKQFSLDAVEFLCRGA